MQKLAILLLVAGTVTPAFTEKHVTGQRVSVEQLKQTLDTTHGGPDAQVAQQLSKLRLTERLSEVSLARLEANAPGPRARKALMLLADTSAFLDVPAAEILSRPAPDHAAQVSMLALARDYVVHTIQKLPDFFATRETTNFEGTPEQVQVSSSPPTVLEPLSEASRSNVTVLYRNGRELLADRKKQQASAKELRTVGEFGPILTTVLDDAANGEVTWSHWEQGAPGPVTVFRYAVPEKESHYLVSYTSDTQDARHDPPYHGEITLNPENGSILRLTVVAELKPDNPMISADLMVEYGPVELGGITYICPLRSVALSRVRTLIRELNFSTGAVEGTSLGEPKTYLNEVLFTQYHLFRADTRILGVNDQEPGRNAPNLGSGSASANASPTSPQH